MYLLDKEKASALNFYLRREAVGGFIEKEKPTIGVNDTLFDEYCITESDPADLAVKYELTPRGRRELLRLRRAGFR